MSTALVIEDQEDLRLLIGKVLGAMGWHTIAAQTGAAALEAARAEPVDLVVTDVTLGDISGLIVARRIRELRPAAKVLFVSGHEPADVRRLAQDEAVPPPGGEPGEGWLQKPFGLAELRESVAGLMGEGAAH